MTIHPFPEASPSFRGAVQRGGDPSSDGVALRVADAGYGGARRTAWTPPATAAAPVVDAAGRDRYTIRSSVGSEMLRRAISGIDGYLSQCCGVKPFDRDARCLLRYAAISSPGDYRLADGTRLDRGDLVIDLHLWNEHIPPVPKRGPDLAWARLVSGRMQHSFALLARAVDADPELRDARAIRAKTNFVGWGGQSESLSRIIGRFGLEDVDEGTASVPERIHDAFENILIGALTWTHNPEALRRDKLIRQRRPVWMSRDMLIRRHAGCLADRRAGG